MINKLRVIDLFDNSHNGTLLDMIYEKQNEIPSMIELKYHKIINGEIQSAENISPVYQFLIATQLLTYID